MLARLLKKILGKPEAMHLYSGPYASWKEARQASSGYDSAAILGKVKKAMLAVKQGKAVYERDSVLFDKPEYSWPLLTALLLAGSHDKRLDVIDFGGSLGGTYYTYRSFLGRFPLLKWRIIEQPKFVAVGKQNFADDILSFHQSITPSVKKDRPNVLLLSGVLPYLEKPYEILEGLLKDSDFSVVVIDRTNVSTGEDWLSVLTVPPAIFEASYPCWFFNKNKILEIFKLHGYELLSEFDPIDKQHPTDPYMGLIFWRPENFTPPKSTR